MRFRNTVWGKKNEEDHGVETIEKPILKPVSDVPQIFHEESKMARVGKFFSFLAMCFLIWQASHFYDELFGGYKFDIAAQSLKTPEQTSLMQEIHRTCQDRYATPNACSLTIRAFANLFLLENPEVVSKDQLPGK